MECVSQLVENYEIFETKGILGKLSEYIPIKFYFDKIFDILITLVESLGRQLRVKSFDAHV